MFLFVNMHSAHEGNLFYGFNFERLLSPITVFEGIQNAFSRW